MSHTLLPAHHQVTLKALATIAKAHREVLSQTPETRQMYQEAIDSIDHLTQQLRQEHAHRYWPITKSGFTVGGPGTSKSRERDDLDVEVQA